MNDLFIRIISVTISLILVGTAKYCYQHRNDYEQAACINFFKMARTRNDTLLVMQRGYLDDGRAIKSSDFNGNYSTIECSIYLTVK